ncbi:MAG: T9SS type A sorting domain-containing protein [Saprospiraceae bacterium]|nr:T9SS type A sorting domain-containing protein [Saprospiraceae bacterium]
MLFYVGVPNLRTAATEGILQLIVRDFSGRTIMQQTREIVEGKNNLSLDCSGLQKGTYLVEMATNDDMQIQKLVIQ